MAFCYLMSSHYQLVCTKLSFYLHDNLGVGMQAICLITVIDVNMNVGVMVLVANCTGPGLLRYTHVLQRIPNLNI